MFNLAHSEFHATLSGFAGADFMSTGNDVLVAPLLLIWCHQQTGHLTMMTNASQPISELIHPIRYPIANTACCLR